MTFNVLIQCSKITLKFDTNWYNNDIKYSMIVWHSNNTALQCSSNEI